MGFAGKHVFGKLNKTDENIVSFVEKKIPKERMEFLKTLLEHNGFEVLVQEIPSKKEDEPSLYTVAVTDLVFNPTTYVYQRRLRTLDGRIVTPAYWNQETDDTNPQYYKRK